jgi:AcrR family transcriptional regulator
VGDLKVRRAEKKARTRELIRTVAQRMFAESGFDAVTVADIARECDVAVQTLFNHFATKEELFFEGRAEWVDGAAAAVRNRAVGVAPLTALREHLMSTVTWFLDVLSDPEIREGIATLEASPALCAYERELHHESVIRLSDALAEACDTDSRAFVSRISSTLIAATWMGAIRALLIEQRGMLLDRAGSEALKTTVSTMAAQVLEQFESNPGLQPDTAFAPLPQATTVTGWPGEVRRAG